MMNKETACAVVRDLLPSYLEQLTEEATNGFIEQHLAECSECRAVKRSMMHVSTPEEQAQAEFLDRLRKARVRRRRRACMAATAVLLALAVCLLPLPRHVDMQVEAVQWRSGHEEQGSHTVQVTIRGVYRDYLFLDDAFSGEIMIGGVEASQRPGAHLDIRLDPTGYLFYPDEEYLHESVGFIIGRPGFDGFVIGLYDKEYREDGSSHGSWQGSDGTVLTWPANSREEAVETTRRILTDQGCTWLTRSVWEAGMTREEYDAKYGQ